MSTVYLATGEKFPDSLAEANAAGFTRNLLYIMRSGCEPLAVLDHTDDFGATKIVLLGCKEIESEEVA